MTTPDSTSQSKLCECGMMNYLLALAAPGIYYDQEGDAVFYEFGPDPHQRCGVRFCFVCGAELPTVHRSDRWEELSGREVSEMKALTEQVSSIDEVRKVLGDPDTDIADYNEVHGSMGRVVRCLGYSTKWRTLIVWAFQYEDGGFAFTWGVKPYEY